MCGNCGLQMKGDSKKNIIKAWNTRATPSDKRVEALLNFMKAKLHHFPVEDQYVATQLLEMFDALPSQEKP